ncbi:MAG: hypothetical protein AAF213_03520 [Pseudomonadota bacterium]
MTLLPATIDDLARLNFAQERGTVIGAVSDRSVEICPSYLLTDDDLKAAFGEAVLIRDGQVSCTDEWLLDGFGFIRDAVIVQGFGEADKSLDQAEQLALSLADNAPRAVVVMGSGSLINVITYAVAQLPMIEQVTVIPTNAMSIADVAYGGLGMVNDRAKNDRRQERDPDLIILSAPVFTSAPSSQHWQGQIEVVKHLMFQRDGDNEAKIESLLTAPGQCSPDDLFASAVQGLKLNIMLRYAIRDGVPAAKDVLNFGHAIAHGIETISDYTVAHADAVRFGLAVDCYDQRSDLTALLCHQPWSPDLLSAVDRLLALSDHQFIEQVEAKYKRHDKLRVLRPAIHAYPYQIGDDLMAFDRVRDVIGFLRSAH